MNDPAEVVGRRIGAALIDLLPLIVIFVVLGLALGEGEAEGGNASITLEGGESLIYLALVVTYFAVCEAIWGQTLGKRALGLVVVTADGARAGVGPAVLRNVLRPIDMAPFLYIVGLIVMLATPRKQRVGDLVAKTFVIRRAAQGQPPGGQPWAQAGPGEGWGQPPGAAGPGGQPPGAAGPAGQPPGGQSWGQPGPAAPQGQPPAEGAWAPPAGAGPPSGSPTDGPPGPPPPGAGPPA